MRPDEHKKKKNANYKKKHGIPLNKNCKKDESKEAKDTSDAREEKKAAKTNDVDLAEGNAQENVSFNTGKFIVNSFSFICTEYFNY